MYCFYHYVHADGSALTDVQNHLIVEEGAADKIDAILNKEIINTKGAAEILDCIEESLEP